MDSYQPDIRTFLDRLITKLSQYKINSDQTQTQPFSGLSTSASLKPLLLTLHCLFPNDFLPSLDILDRKLVHRLLCMDTCDITSSKPDETAQSEPDPIFLVISASAPPLLPGASLATLSTRNQGKVYEVRLRAWNCSCPTFTLSAYRDSHQLSEVMVSNHASVGEAEPSKDEPVAYPFGGTLARGTAWFSPPVCKHILACILCVRCPELFGTDGDGRFAVPMEELAGWCAGWGG
ncbi:Zinc fingerSWIM-type [Penicillium sp. IBT 31633x]|nr:Zinc fingerSWIM-type [Penicillium sp. IBT 31633x]